MNAICVLAYLALCDLFADLVLASFGEEKCYIPNITIPVCCAGYFEESGKCKECPIGTESERNGSCTACIYPFYGHKCFHECKCFGTNRCDNVLGCIAVTTSADVSATDTEKQDTDENRHIDKMTILSISVALFSLLVVGATAVSKCCCKMNQNKDIIQAITQLGNNDEMSKRKTNIYGTYEKKTTEDVYEFDVNQDEETYASIRDSQVLPSLYSTENDDCLQHGGSLKYDTTGYNHLTLMGTRNTPGSRKPQPFTGVVLGKKLFTFSDV